MGSALENSKNILLFVGPEHLNFRKRHLGKCRYGNALGPWVSWAEKRNQALRRIESRRIIVST